MKTIKYLFLSASLLFSQWLFAAINVNTATVEELEQLNGIGRVKATAIVEHRNQHGAFKEAADLLKVKGIGQAILNKIADELIFELPPEDMKNQGSAQKDAPTKN